MLRYAQFGQTGTVTDNVHAQDPFLSASLPIAPAFTRRSSSRGIAAMCAV